MFRPLEGIEVKSQLSLSLLPSMLSTSYHCDQVLTNLFHGRSPACGHAIKSCHFLIEMVSHVFGFQFIEIFSNATLKADRRSYPANGKVQPVPSQGHLACMPCERLTEVQLQKEVVALPLPVAVSISR